MSVKQTVVSPNNDRRNPFNNKKHLLTDPVFLIGNGKSREHFDLERLRGKGTIIGCNALYRDFFPDILIAIDAKLLKEIKESDYKGFCIIPKGRSVKVPSASICRIEKFNTSGCFAMKMIDTIMQPSKCYMLGMDAYPGNVYDKTKNYSDNTLQNFKGVNDYYLEALRGVGSTVFINVNEKDAWNPEAHKTGKYTVINYKSFENEILYRK